MTGSMHVEQVRLASWNPEEHTELFVAPRLAGGERPAITAATWWAAGLAAAVVLMPCLVIQLRRRLGCGGASAPGQVTGRGAVVGLAVARPAQAVPGAALV